MAHVSSQAVGTIIDHYADVIEGGNAYNAGTSYDGIPGRYSNDNGLRTGDDSPLSALGAGTSTTVNIANTYSWPESRWVKDGTPGFWLLCTTGATQAVNQARRITAWDNATQTFTTDAFSEAPGATGEFTVLQGFKRLPNTIDINADDTISEGGYDRSFDLEVMPVTPRDYYGDGLQTWDGELRLTLRLLKLARLHDWHASVVENLTILASAMTYNLGSNDHRDGTYVRALLRPTAAPEFVKDDERKVVATVVMPIIYRLDSRM